MRIAAEDLTRLYNENFNPDDEYLGSDKEVHAIKPVVSVSVTTYQQSGYIRECLDGILMQKTDFHIEILIGEDGSSDGTREICIEYAHKYPESIRLFLRDRSSSNVFDKNGKRICSFNGKWNRKSARGKYIALCEGDDYWTDPLKLQKQVDFLEAHSNYSMVCTNYSTVDENSTIIKLRVWEESKTHHYINQETVLGKYTPQTLTVLFRREYLKRFESEFSKYTFPNGDVALFSAITRFGPCYFMDEITGCYRHNSEGIWSKKSTSQKLKMRLSTFENLLLFHSEEKKLRKIIIKRIVVTSRVLCIVSIKEAALLDFVTFLYSYLHYKSVSVYDDLFRDKKGL